MKLLSLVGIWLLYSTYVVNAAIDSKEEVLHHLAKRNSKQRQNYLPKHLTPTSYKLKLQPLGQDGLFQHFRGLVYINISCQEATDTIILHAHNNIQVVLADSTIYSMGQWDRTYQQSLFKRVEDSHHYQRVSPSTLVHNVTITKLKRDINNDRCEIILKEKLKKGMMYQLKLEFSGNISTGDTSAFYQQFYEDYKTTEKRWYMAVDTTMFKARRVFPCFDEKHFKATIELSIIRPDNMKAVSSMPLSSTESVVHRAGWKIDHFERTPPMSLKGLSAVIFDPRSLLPVPPRQVSGGLTIRGYAHPSVFALFQTLMDKVSHIVKNMQAYTGIDFPLPELYLLAIPHEQSYGHSWGLIRFSDKILTEDFFHSLIPKDIVDQWTEYLITPNSVEDDDLIIGLRVYLLYNSLKEIMSTEHIIGSKTLFDRLLFYELGFTNVTLRNFATFKAMLSAMTIRMFNYTLTEKTLKKALYSFMLDRSFKTFTEDDFFDALDNQAWLDGVLPVAMSTHDIAKSWTEKKRFPVVTVTRNYANNSATIEQSTFLREWPHSAPDVSSYVWWIPLMYLTRVSLDVSPFMTFGWMRDKKIAISNLPRRDIFIIVNPENIGLYMVNYDETNWRLLSDYLVESVSGRRQPQIPADTRSKLLHDAIYLAEGGELDFDVALDMTLFIKQEQDPVVWHTVYDVFDELKGILNDTPAFHKLLIYMRHMFASAFGTSNNMMESDILIMTGYKPLLDKARMDFRGMLENNTLVDMPIGTLCSVLRWSEEEWELGFRQAMYIHTVDESSHRSIFLLSKLAECTNNPDNVHRILTVVLLDSNNTFTSDEKEEIMESIHDYITFIKFISDHWSSLESYFQSKSYLWNKMFEEATKDIKTQEGFELVANLYHSFQKKMGSAQRIVQHSLEIIKENVFGRYKCISVIDAWLDRQILTLSI